jgi:Arc/MetJ-type ribon-helix-helix transcriptional regulator
MKLSVSLSDADIEFIDRYAECHDVKTRSAVLHKAVKVLQEEDLADAYEEAFIEWEESGEATIWDRAVRDGLEDDRYEAR